MDRSGVSVSPVQRTSVVCSVACVVEVLKGVPVISGSL